jgi:muconate cycloisomerase
MSISIAEPETALAEASMYLDRGFRALKVKGNANSDRLLDTLGALRAGLGESWTLRVDLNMAYDSAKEALRVIRALDQFVVASVEQPLPAEDLDGARFLTAHSPVPIMLDESVWTQADAFRAISTRACDLVNIYVSEAGGITAAYEIATMCAAANIGTVVGSMPELAIGTVAAAHLAFAMPRLDQPSDVCGHLYHSGDVAHHSLEVTDGRLRAPDTPGLGVSIDHERLDYYRTEL